LKEKEGIRGMSDGVLKAMYSQKGSGEGNRNNSESRGLHLKREKKKKKREGRVRLGSKSDTSGKRKACLL